MAVVDDHRAHAEGPSWGAVEVERPLGVSVLPRLGEQLRHRLGRERVTVAARHQRVRWRVLIDDAAVFVADHYALGQGVERASESDGVRACLGDGFRCRPGYLLEVGQRVFEGRVLGRWVEAKTRPEGDHSLCERTPPGTTADDQCK